MNDIKLTLPDGLTIQELLSYIDNAPADLECFRRLGCISKECYTLYKQAYDNFCEVNSKEYLNGRDKKDDNRIKGKVLEDLVDVLFKATGGYYETYRNIRNGSNEIDIFLKFSDKAYRLDKIIKERYSNLVGECKNYKSTVKVTYVGKFYSLLQSTNKKIGIMFSHDGFSGEHWGGATGLAKKLFLLKEDVGNKIYIIDFNINDFTSLLEGKSFFNILDDKCLELELGTDDIIKYISEHPNEKKIKGNL